jgi:acyl carrier protein
MTPDTVRELLAEARIFPGLPGDLTDDTELVLDSLGLVWLLHEVEQRYGLAVQPTDEEVEGFTSARRIADYLSTAAAGAVGSSAVGSSAVGSSAVGSSAVGGGDER